MQNSEIKSLLLSKEGALLCYSPYSFFRNIELTRLVNDTVVEPLVGAIKRGATNTVNLTVKNREHVFFVKKLQWDTEYFKFPIYKIEYIFYDHTDIDVLNEAINIFVSCHANESHAHYTIDVPVEDIHLLQGISNSKFKIIEPRNYYHLNNVQEITMRGYKTRLANDNDIDALKEVARKCRNVYDRVHADSAFSDEVADEYLATFAEQCVKGFADFTLVPDVPELDAFGFLASNKPYKVYDTQVSKFVLAAIDNSVQKGWYFKLMVDQINLLKKEGADCLTAITQSSNRGSIHTWEKLGFKQHASSIVFSYRNC